MAKKKATVGKKGKQGKRARRGVVGVPRAAPANAVRSVCAITDPFCPAALGSRYPDGLGVRSGTYTLRQSAIIATNATGNAALHFSPANFPFFTATFNAAGASFDSPVQLFQVGSVDSWVTGNFVKTLRMISGGLRFMPITSMTNNSGFVIVSDIPAFPPLATTFTYGVMNGDENRMVNMNNPQGFTWVSKSIGPGAHLFESVSTNTSFLTTTNDWSACVIQVVGAQASTNVALVEFVAHYEYTMSFQSATGGVSAGIVQLGAPDSPALRNAAAKTSRVMDTVVAGGIEARDQVVKTLATAAIRNIAGGVMNYFVPGSGTAYKMLSNAQNLD